LKEKLKERQLITMKIDKELEEFIENSKEVDAIFYFIASEHEEIGRIALEEISERFAVLSGYESYIVSSGANVQDGEELLKEIKQLHTKNIEFAYYDVNEKEATLLSKKEARRFIKYLEYTDNSVQIIQEILKEDVATNYV